MDIWVLLAFLVYLLAVFAIGLVAYKRTRDLSDYILGGRRLGSLVSALSAGASDMSGWLLLGLPGLIYSEGLKGLWLALGLLLGTFLNWQIVAKKLRVFSYHFDNSLTIPEYLERRFFDDTGILRTISALMILFFFTIYTSSGLVAGGKLFNSVFGVPYIYAMGIGAATILIYTFLGGFLAVSWTDAFQALLMLFTLIVVPILAFSTHGLDFSNGIDDGFFDIFRDKDGNFYSVFSLISLLAWGLGYFGQPHILARFMATDSLRDVEKAKVIGTSWTGLSLAGAILVGVAGAIHFSTSLADPEKVFIFLVRDFMHPLISGICLAGILAAIMSTADSQLLVSASALTEDFYRARFRPEASEKELILIGRLTVLLVSLVAIFLARDPSSKVLDMVAYAWAGFGASFGPALILSLFWKEMTRPGAMAGILTGGLTVIVWRNLHGGIFELYEMVPGFFISTVAIIIFSLFIPKTFEDQRNLERIKTTFERGLAEL